MKMILSLAGFLVPGLCFAEMHQNPTWTSVNDSVMGGISQGSALPLEGGLLRFAGILSLENRGGFSSVRSDSPEYGREGSEDFLLTVRGDGRSYYFDLRTRESQRAFSYRQSFSTRAGEIVKIRLPLSGFEPTRFGRRIRLASSLDPAQIRSIGFTLSDKKEGPFRLDVLNIERVPAEDAGTPGESRL